MIDNIIKGATCRVTCGTESGTAYLVAEGTLITARHCIISAIESATPIEIALRVGNGESTVGATVIGHSEDLDVALLQVPDCSSRTPIPLTTVLPREGSDWHSFGYPEGKQSIGHRTAGSIAQVLSVPHNRIDIDLAIDPNTALLSYRGYSGAPVVTDNASCGIIRLKVDGTIGAISINRLQKFLLQYDIDISEAQDPAPTPEVPNVLAERDVFHEDFERLVVSTPGHYLFLEGAHGIGKTTFCTGFQPGNPILLNLGAYSIRVPERGSSPVYRIQPEIFFDWLLTSVTSLMTGEPARKEERTYTMLIRDTAALLTHFSQHCGSAGKQGILFVDGLNEAQHGSTQFVSKLLGLLPVVLPPHITIVLTAPNYASLAVELSERVKAANVLALPPLSDESTKAFCWQELAENRATVTLVDRICEKAKGHPLYLRYLIEYVNNTPNDDILAQFPTLGGPIEHYYETIWAKLVLNSDTVQLLAILGRLRWGIAMGDLMKMLTQAEQASFVSTLTRIRHLLLNPNNTTIYHPSFAAFLVSKTSDLDTIIHERLALFCRKEQSINYCLLNIVFHFLHTGPQKDVRAVAECSQEWVDRCVDRGVEPDVLLSDIEATVSLAIMDAPAPDVLRLFLLSQRVAFRYNNLFAQSAELIAKALIALRRPDEALQHCFRFDILVIDPEEALQVANILIQTGFSEEAVHLLTLLHRKVLEAYDTSRIDLETFMRVSEVHIRTLFFLRLADDRQTMPQVLRVLKNVQRVLAQLSDGENEDLLDECWSGLACISTSYFLAFRDTYPDLKELRRLAGSEVPERYLDQLVFVLLDCLRSIAIYGLRKDLGSLAQLFADVEDLVAAGAGVAERMLEPFIDALIRLGARPSLVHLLAATLRSSLAGPIRIMAGNGVDVAFADMLQGCAGWRINSYLGNVPQCPLVGVFNRAHWFSSLEQLLQALFWCEGQARRAKALGDEALARQSFEQLSRAVLHPLRFTLAQRVKWKDSYAIPEQVLPVVYDHVTTLLIDCFPDELAPFLQRLSESAADQCGLYSEGYREVMNVVLQALTKYDAGNEISQLVLQLLRKWNEHVTNGIENRHELVPEILRLIPLFVKLGANEEADRLYQRMLGVSMGPTWYKEDQLGLMTSILIEMPESDNVHAQLPAIAGYLERASGEMTFQRFVRYEKSVLIGQMFRRQMFGSGCRYFQRASCGTKAELMSDSARGTVDKASLTEGMHYPGGALDEQDAILQLVNNAANVDWRLRWALLEIFQCGDERHLTDYAAAYAALVNEVGNNSGALAEMIKRAEFLIGCEISPQDRQTFAGAFREAVDPAYHAEFSKLIAWVPSPRADPTPISTQSDTGNQDESKSGANEDDFFFPGVFGRRSSMTDAEGAWAAAEAARNLGNLGAAKTEAVKVLQVLQDGGWSIWRGSGGVAENAESLLREGATGAEEVFRYYAPLIEPERHTPKWAVAQHLFTTTAKLMTEEQRIRALEDAIEHVHLMVGDAVDEIATFGFLGTENNSSEPDFELFRFILWLTDHPQWLRRDRAAALITWLVESTSTYRKMAIEGAFSAADGYRAEVLCGVLDGMSAAQPREVWDEMRAILDIESVFLQCKHVSRLVVLHRLAERGRNADSASGAEVAAGVLALFRPGAIQLDTSTSESQLPIWATCLQSEWRALDEMGLVTNGLVREFQAKMDDLSAPLSADSAWELEKAVSLSFRQPAGRQLSRWEGNVRYALNSALLPYVSQQDFGRVESVMRVFNPSVPERTVTAGFTSLIESALAAIARGTDFGAVIGDTDRFFLNCHAMAEHGDMGEVVHLEVIAVIVPSSTTKRGFFLPDIHSSFGSREIPVLSAVTSATETCCHLKPTTALFGSFTPAFPLPGFMTAIKGSAADFARVNWRDGRSSEPRWTGRPVQEGCLLAVEKAAVQLPKGVKLAWIIRVTGNPVIMVDSQNTRLY